MRPHLARRAVLTSVAALWLVSLRLPALVAPGIAPMTGLDLLLRGWQGVSHGIVAWYANPLLGAALVSAAFGRDKLGAIFSGLAGLIALTSFAIEPTLRMQILRVPDVQLLTGFYVWLAAIAALLSWSVARATMRRRAR